MDPQDWSVDLLLSGTVTGVGFRQWAAREATRLALGGWIRNNVDRTVSVHVEGPRETVEAFVEKLRRPNLEGSVVDVVDVRDAELHGYSEFSIEY